MTLNKKDRVPYRMDLGLLYGGKLQCVVKGNLAKPQPDNVMVQINGITIKMSNQNCKNGCYYYEYDGDDDPFNFKGTVGDRISARISW